MSLRPIKNYIKNFQYKAIIILKKKNKLEQTVSELIKKIKNNG